MCENKSFDDTHMYIKRPNHTQFGPLKSATSAPVLNMNALIISVTNKSVQVNLDCEPDEDPKKNKKYWQDVAGLRGAREEYLKYDLRELNGENSRLRYAVKFLSGRLNLAEKQIEELKSQRKCRCHRVEEEYIPPNYRGLCLCGEPCPCLICSGSMEHQVNSLPSQILSKSPMPGEDLHQPEGQIHMPPVHQFLKDWTDCLNSFCELEMRAPLI